ncbi:hypothetical protein DFH09DRAFT_1075818 [Mycena vulgaris]|nr:hypothetical protein DFH09DRAFT_1075818 [Mycena vulgaris]
MAALLGAQIFQLATVPTERLSYEVMRHRTESTGKREDFSQSESDRLRARAEDLDGSSYSRERKSVMHWSEVHERPKIYHVGQRLSSGTDRRRVRQRFAVWGYISRPGVRPSMLFVNQKIFDDSNSRGTVLDIGVLARKFALDRRTCGDVSAARDELQETVYLMREPGPKFLDQTVRLRRDESANTAMVSDRSLHCGGVFAGRVLSFVSSKPQKDESSNSCRSLVQKSHEVQRSENIREGVSGKASDYCARLE